MYKTNTFGSKRFEPQWILSVQRTHGECNIINQKIKDTLLAELEVWDLQFFGHYYISKLSEKYLQILDVELSKLLEVPKSPYI